VLHTALEPQGEGLQGSISSTTGAAEEENKRFVHCTVQRYPVLKKKKFKMQLPSMISYFLEKLLLFVQNL
jgi:hypothetical protein